jgi:uncharacterized damage-inducible protein DinB
MNTREFFRERFKAERKAFVNVLRALPNDRLDYKPTEKNMAAGDIAWFLVLELRTLNDLAKNFEHHWEQPPNPKSIDAIVSAYEAAADDMESQLASMDDAKWGKECRMFYNGKLMKTAPLGETIWDFFFDAIHHRGQLTAYLRPMGGKVPSTYGPTADTR